MQREKLYNLSRTAYFIVALFVLKIDKTLGSQISAFRKRNVLFCRKTNLFFLISSFYYLICLLNKTKHTTRCSVISSTSYKEQL